MVGVLLTSWGGDDATMFAQDWVAVARSLGCTAHALERFARSLLEHAAQQDDASRGGPLAATPSGAAAGGSGATASPLATANTQQTTATVNRGKRTDPSNPHTTKEGGTSGPEPFRPRGLGEGVDGTRVPAPLSSPKWTPPDQGAGAHDSEDVTAEHLKMLAKARSMVAGARLQGMDDATRHLDHYLDGSGEPLEVDVDKLIREDISVKDAIQERENTLGRDAVKAAKDSGAKGPMTFPINTNWTGTNANDSDNWKYATNGMSHNASGHVTVYPPDSPGGKWRYEMETEVAYRDRYNWDTGKQIQVNDDMVQDDDMGSLHRAGLAKEYTLHGVSSKRQSSGVVG